MLTIAGLILALVVMFMAGLAIGFVYGAIIVGRKE